MSSNDALSRELADITFLVAEMIKQEFHQTAGKNAPSLTQFKMLYSIRDGIAQVGKLAGMFGISQPAASKMVNGLVKDGLIKRHPHPTDRRQIELRITPKATVSMENMYRRAYTKIDERLKDVSEVKKKSLVKNLQEVKELLKISAVVGLFCILGGANFAQASAVSLDQYLQQVQGSNEGYQGDVMNRDANLAVSAEADIPFAVQAFGNYTYTDDRRQTIVPAFEGTRTVTDATQFGIKKLFDFGLQSQLYYGISQNTLYGVSAGLVPQTSLITTGLTLAVTQSLWQNGFGETDKATARSTQAKDLAASYNSTYSAKQTLADAETRYWALVVARETVSIQKQSSDRTNSIRDFNVKRVRSHLIDEADLLTSDAQARSSQFDLKTAIDNERVAARAFNTERGIDSDEVLEDLVTLDPEMIGQLPAPVRTGVREDVKAAEQNQLAAVADSDIAIQRQQPALNLVGTVSTNGLDQGFTESAHDTWSGNYPYFQIGMNFSVPLDFGTVSSVKRAYAAQMKGTELIYHRRLFDQENDWKDLSKKFSEAKERLLIAVDLEKAQKMKFSRETTRQKQGLTTTYQVFQYDIDYLNAQLNRIQTQAVILNLVAQMKTYRSTF